jgi:propanol-preferring alcohol dehydrogenase
MRAMLLEQPGPIESSPLKWRDDVPDPQPGPGEVRVRVSCCAICRTDLHIIEGDIPMPKRPVIPGHQIVGIVDQLGPGCSNRHVGQRVGVGWLRHTCGRCRFCTTGRENLCEYSQYTGYHADGGYADYATVPEAFTYALLKQFDDVHTAPLLCAGIIGYRALLRSGVRKGEKLAIFGFGSSAHVVIQIARRRGCEVYVVSRGESHRKLALEMGATWAGGDAREMPKKAQAAIVFAPAGEVVLPALECLDRGGVVALAGIHMSPIPPIDYDKYLFQERDIHPVTANTREDGRNLLAESAAAGISPHVRTYPLEGANEALLDMKHGRIDGTGVLLVSSPAS